MWWFLLLLVPVAAFFVFPLVGTVTPLKTIGRVYLRAMLKKYGVAELVPDPCLRELTEHGAALARKLARMNRRGVKAQMIEVMDGLAGEVSTWILRTTPPTWHKGFVPETLLKYGISYGAGWRQPGA
jgi:hypothetical protein